jgi:hypothetical protein
LLGQSFLQLSKQEPSLELYHWLSFLRFVWFWPFYKSFLNLLAIFYMNEIVFAHFLNEIISVFCDIFVVIG